MPYPAHYLCIKPDELPGISGEANPISNLPHLWLRGHSSNSSCFSPEFGNGNHHLIGDMPEVVRWCYPGKTPRKLMTVEEHMAWLVQIRRGMADAFNRSPPFSCADATRDPRWKQAENSRLGLNFNGDLGVKIFFERNIFHGTTLRRKRKNTSFIIT